MSEQRQIITLFAITMAVGIAALSIIGFIPSLVRDDDVLVEEYEAVFFPDGRLTEEYRYVIKANRFRFLFRVWEGPLSTEPYNDPYIEPVEIEAPAGAISYFRDVSGSVYVEEPYSNEREIVDSISALAEMNEAGAYKHDRYGTGSWSVRYVFVIHPPLEFDDDLVHLNLKLASKHIEYREVRVIFEDEELVVVDKAAGMVVHPGHGHHEAKY